MRGTYQIPVLLWTNPYLAITPLTEAPQLLNLRVRMLHFVLLGESGWVVNSDITTQAEENPRSLVGKKSRVGPCGDTC